MQNTQEGYQILPPMDKERYTEIQGMEGPFMTRSGKVVYYDPQEGSYYDRDTDMYLTYDEWKALDEEMNPNEVEREKRRASNMPYGNDPKIKKTTKDKSTYMKPIISPRDIPSFGTILNNATERMNEGMMSDIHARISTADDPEQEIIDMMNDFNSPEGDIIRREYEITAGEHGLHGDDDMETIVAIMADDIGVAEGHSPHKKGTKKYKAHMAAMHANSAEPKGKMIEGVKRNILYREIGKRLAKGHSIDRIKKYYKDIDDKHPGHIEKIVQALKDRNEIPEDSMNEGKEKNYICVHAKKGTHQCKADSTYGAAKKAAEFWGMKSTAGIDVHLTDEPKTATEGAMDDEIAAYYKQLKLPNMKSWKKLTKQESVKEDDIDEDATQRAGDIELLKPMINMDPKVLPIYAKNIIKKYPHMQRSVTAMLGKNESVDINKLKASINMTEATDSEAVAGYVRTLLNSKHDTWEKVDEEINFVISKLTEGHQAYAEEARTELHKRWMQEYFDKDIKVSENVDTMRKIVANKSAMPVKFSDGTMKVDMTSANIFLQAYDQMKERNQEKINQMMQTKAGFLRVMDFIYGAMK